MLRVLCSIVVLVCIRSVPVSAQTILTLEEVIARARVQAPAVVVAAARVAEMEAGLIDLTPRFRDNPVVETAVGPRVGAGAGVDVEIGISQVFETGGQRDARLAGGRALVERERAVVTGAMRRAVFDAATAFMQALAAAERVRIAEAEDSLSRDVRAATERRYELGDIAAIDLNLARIDSARTAAELGVARAERTEALGVLRQLLRLPAGEAVEVRGSLSLPPLAALEQLAQRIGQRPDFAILDAEAREADAQVTLGRALRRPDVGIRAAYQREDVDTIILGGLIVTVPAFQRGTGIAFAGQARAARIRLEIETTTQAALAELTTAYAAHEQRLRVAEAFARDTAASVADNEALARRSYEAGELNLLEFLLIRRDALQTRVLLVGRQLDAAVSKLSVDFLSGVLQ